MKKILAVSSFLLASALLFAAHAPTIRKNIQVEEKIQEIEIFGDITIILTNEPVGTIYAEAHPGYIEMIKVKTRKEKLIVDNRNRSPFFKSTIYIPAAGIKSITVNGNGNILSEKIIETENLLITLNGISVVKIAAAQKGKIKVKAAGDYELDN